MSAASSSTLAAAEANSATIYAVATAEAAALAGAAQGRIAYTLTYNMIKQNQGALSLPLIALAFAAITEGLIAYAETEAAGALAESAVSRELQAAIRRVEAGAT
jgi:hypothetical protein